MPEHWHFAATSSPRASRCGDSNPGPHHYELFTLTRQSRWVSKITSRKRLRVPPVCQSARRRCRSEALGGVQGIVDVLRASRNGCRRDWGWKQRSGHSRTEHAVPGGVMSATSAECWDNREGAREPGRFNCWVAAGELACSPAAAVASCGSRGVGWVGSSARGRSGPRLGRVGRRPGRSCGSAARPRRAR
jgi:hypothetical protein